LNIIKGCNWVWYGAIANSVSTEFGFSLRQVNMLGNVPHISYLFFSWCVPVLVGRWGLRWSVSIQSAACRRRAYVYCVRRANGVFNRVYSGPRYSFCLRGYALPERRNGTNGSAHGAAASPDTEKALPPLPVPISSTAARQKAKQ